MASSVWPQWLASGLAIFFCSAPLVAGTHTAATVSVSITNTGKCIIGVSPSTGVNFGAYDPIGAQKTNPIDNSSVTISISCTKGPGRLSPTLGMDLGVNALASQRRMKHATAADYLNYEIYQPDVTGATCPYTTVWGNSGGSLFAPVSPTDKAPRSYKLCARLAAGQDPGVGTFSDTITATVNF